MLNIILLFIVDLAAHRVNFAHGEGSLRMSVYTVALLMLIRGFFQRGGRPIERHNDIGHLIMYNVVYNMQRKNLKKHCTFCGNICKVHLENCFTSD